MTDDCSGGGRRERAEEKSWGDGSHSDMSTTHLCTPLSIRTKQAHARLKKKMLCFLVSVSFFRLLWTVAHKYFGSTTFLPPSDLRRYKWPTKIYFYEA